MQVCTHTQIFILLSTQISCVEGLYDKAKYKKEKYEMRSTDLKTKVLDLMLYRGGCNSVHLNELFVVLVLNASFRLIPQLISKNC